MKCSDDKLLTPIYLQLSEKMPWPEDQVFYLLTGNGLFLCRNNEHFRSCIPARSWPGELAEQEEFVDLRYPRLPRRLLERAVGFFDAVARRHDAEAALLLVWDKRKELYRLIVPRQRCTVYESWQGSTYPQSVHYDMPARVPRNWVVVGDIHSHVDYPAYASITDQHDEQYRTGLHIVVGRIYDEPPEFHVEATVDGVRFPVQQDQAFEGYEFRRDDFPEKWFDWLKIEVNSSYSFSSAGGSRKNKWKESRSSLNGYGNMAEPPGVNAWNSATGCTAIPGDSGWDSGNGKKRKSGGAGSGRGKRR